MSVSCRLHIQQYQIQQGKKCPLLSGKPVFLMYSHAKKAHSHEKIQLPFYCLINEYELQTHIGHLSVYILKFSVALSRFIFNRKKYL